METKGFYPVWRIAFFQEKLQISSPPKEVERTGSYWTEKGERKNAKEKKKEGVKTTRGFLPDEDGG